MTEIDLRRSKTLAAARTASGDLERVGSTVVDLQPGNATRYLMTMVVTPDGLVVALPYFRVSNVVGRYGNDEVYIREKLGRSPSGDGLNDEDIRVVTEFLNLVGES